MRNVSECENSAGYKDIGAQSTVVSVHIVVFTV